MEEGVLYQAQRKRDYAEYLDLVRKGRTATAEEVQRRRELRKVINPPKKGKVK